MKKAKHHLWKFTVVAGIVFLAFFAETELAETVRETLAEAYLQVSSFVAITLLAFYFLERRLRMNTAQLLKKYQKWQVPIAAVVGALPGCGGAIIVITQFVLGRIGFGSMVAVLTSTMGDAAFLLLARAPGTAVLIMALSIIAGTLTGWAVEKYHGRDFMKVRREGWKNFRIRCGDVVSYRRIVHFAWYGLLVPGIVFGIASAFQIDANEWFGAVAVYRPAEWVGVAGALSCLVVWAALPDKGISIINLAAHPACRTHVKTKNRVIFETGFVTTWVIAAFLVFELGFYWSLFDLRALFHLSAPFIPLIATLIGFIPGCGPQIIVTTLYLNGIAPFSAQIANAISNDGDALFPAIALAPKTAILATLYTAIPALILGYGFYFFEVFSAQ
ncbi:MAG: hypothetical protein EA357_03975 [Micavibrio sp.]|nr:MAG: hypothetical protein EA357_03975 [Micavibrio sp.]